MRCRDPNHLMRTDPLLGLGSNGYGCDHAIARTKPWAATRIFIGLRGTLLGVRSMRELGVLSGNLAALDRLALFTVFGHLPK